MIRLKKKGPARNAPAESESWRPTELLSVAQAAEFLGVAEITVRRWLKARLIPFRRAGKQIRIDRADLLGFLTRE